MIRRQPIFLATSNPGKVRDFAGAAAVYGIEITALPGFAQRFLGVVDEPEGDVGIDLVEDAGRGKTI